MRQATISRVYATRANTSNKHLKRKKKKTKFRGKENVFGPGSKKDSAQCVRACVSRKDNTPPHLRDCLRFEK
ncbi:Uncharacterized protein APZ42_024837 [Daphnia magna]|uniref:Uncharacterized protein n=1 Tax=Daphnia magna TaxID=35525 RepID=A0A162DEE5_9CRUS|nr:Uncharacterized protein APZ42_024837 [Daphnia magna]